MNNLWLYIHGCAENLECWIAWSNRKSFIYIHTLTYIHICTLATSMSYIYTDMVVQIHRYISFYLHTCTCVHMHVFINTMCTHTHIHTYIHSHTCTLICSLNLLRQQSADVRYSPLIEAAGKFLELPASALDYF